MCGLQYKEILATVIIFFICTITNTINQTEKIYKTNILILEKSPNFEDRGGERSPPLFNSL